MNLDPAVTRRLISAAAETVLSHAEELTELDRAIGDGDHGLNMKRGFEAVLADADSLAAQPLADMLKGTGTRLVMTIGGASGPLYGSLLMAMGKAAAAAGGSMDLPAAARIFAEGVEAVRRRGKSDAGEKTMLDVLIPVSATLAAAAEGSLTARDGASLAAALRETADRGLESTRPMQATKGRASFLGPRSVGHLDPGARSSQLLLHAVISVLAASAGADAGRTQREGAA